MQRPAFIENIHQAFQVNPIVALLGPRQCGKTTLARKFMENNSSFKPQNYFDLEDNEHLARLTNPKLALQGLTGLILIDEIQRVPELFPTLRVLVDRANNQQRYLILGSASRELLRQSSESLAGRISYLELTPFTLQETKEVMPLWVRGGFPRSYLAETESLSYQWRNDYIRTYLEQDIPNLGFRIPPNELRRFWMMLAHYHGGILNASEIGNAMGVSHKTVRHYIDILTGTFMIRELQPWFENISKRQVKTPKIYFRDSGIYHTLLGLIDEAALQVHPKLGASWEGFALEQTIRCHNASTEECFFWATHGHAELDLIIFKNGKRFGFEFKFSEAPRLTRSMHIALHDLKLDELTIVYPGMHEFALEERIKVVGLMQLVRSSKDQTGSSIF